MPRARPHPARGAGVAGARRAARRRVHHRARRLHRGARAARAGARLPARVARAASRGRAHSGPLDGERAARARPAALQRRPRAGRDGGALPRPHRAGRAAPRLAPARAARAAAGGLHVARRDGRGGAVRARRAVGARRRRRRSPGPRGRLGRRLRLGVRGGRRSARARGLHLLHPQHPRGPATRRCVRHGLGRLGRPLQPGAAPRRDRDDGRGRWAPPLRATSWSSTRSTIRRSPSGARAPWFARRATSTRCSAHQTACGCTRCPVATACTPRRARRLRRSWPRRSTCRRLRPRRRSSRSRRPGRSRTRWRGPSGRRPSARPAARLPGESLPEDVDTNEPDRPHRTRPRRPTARGPQSDALPTSPRRSGRRLRNDRSAVHRRRTI